VSTGYQGDFDIDEEEEKTRAVEEAFVRNQVIHENVLTTFSSPQGEFTLAWLYEITKLGKTTFVAGQADTTAFNEGRRSVILEIQGQMRIDDEELFRRARGVTRALEKKK